MTDNVQNPRDGDPHPTKPLRRWCERCNDWIGGSHYHCSNCGKPSGAYGHYEGTRFNCPPDPKPLPPLKPPRACPRGCKDADDCMASLIDPCPLGRYQTDESGRFQPCGCLERSRCKGCGNCTICVGCFCGEE